MLVLKNRGKVRDLYSVSHEVLVMVASDRISAFDVVLDSFIPGKGEILTKMSLFWFKFASKIVKNHVLEDQSILNSPEFESVKNKAIVVKSLKIIPIEAIVRGYISGSAWKQYKKVGRITSHSLPQNLKESEKLPTPIFTPSTKAEVGDHDENITLDQCADIIGSDLASKIEKVSLELYSSAYNYAYARGIIIADTKFEFGLDENNELVLADEIFTPGDVGYVAGKVQPSFDKQYLREFLLSTGQDSKKGVMLPKEIVDQTLEKYRQAYSMLCE